MSKFLLTTLVSLFALSAIADEQRPAAEPFDETVLKLCRRIIAVHEARIEDVKGQRTKVSETLSGALPKLESVMKEIQKVYIESGPQELKDIVAQYASEYRRVGQLENLDEGDRKDLQSFLTTTLTEQINKKAREISDWNSKWSLDNQQHRDKLKPFFTSSTNNNCKIQDGKVLACYRCDVFLEGKDSPRCMIAFNMDLETGRIFGLENLEVQKDYLSYMARQTNNPNDYYSYQQQRNYDAEIATLDSGDALPQICKKVWRNMKGGGTQPTTEAAHK